MFAFVFAVNKEQSAILILSFVHCQLTVSPEGDVVVVYGFLVAAIVFEKVGVIVMDFGIVRKSLDTRTEK